MELTPEVIAAVHAHDAATALCQATTLSRNGNYIVTCTQAEVGHDPEWHHGEDRQTGPRDWEV